jgi:ABC-type dipeptide/oligopeptide/nickel transport system ATPase subunit
MIHSRTSDNFLVRRSVIQPDLKIDNLTNVFTKKSGIEQSLASAIISVVIQYVIQYAASSGRGKGGIQNIMSILSNLQSNITSEHPLVNQVQQRTGLKDTQLVINHVENALNFIAQEADVNPEGIESLFRNIQGPVTGNGVRSADREKAKKSLGGLIKGFFEAK